VNEPAASFPSLAVDRATATGYCGISLRFIFRRLEHAHVSKTEPFKRLNDEPDSFLCSAPTATVTVLCPQLPSPAPARDDAAIEKVVASSLEGPRKPTGTLTPVLVHSESLERTTRKCGCRSAKAAAKGSRGQQAELLALFDFNPPDLNFLIELKPKEFFCSVE